MNFNEILRKNVTCHDTRRHKKSGLHPLSRKHNCRRTARSAGSQIYPPVFLGLRQLLMLTTSGNENSDNYELATQ